MRAKCAIVSVIACGILGWMALNGVAATGSIRYHQFNNIGGAEVRNLTNSSRFPNSPDRVEYVTQFENPEGFGDHADNYGVQFVGFVHPPASGDYRFFVASDDPSALYLSTDENPANKVLIAQEPQWAGFREWTGNAEGRRGVCLEGICENASPLIHLESGRKYFVEVLFKENAGYDNASVTWQLPGDPLPTNGSPPIAGEYLSRYDVPAKIPMDEPRSLAILAGRVATFSANITGSPPLTIQWYRDGQPIPGANRSSYSFQTQGDCHGGGDNGSTFYVVASNSFLVVTSRTATLTVVVDDLPPSVASVSASSTFDRVTVVFNELVDPDSAMDVFNYSIVDGQQHEVGLSIGEMNHDGESVTLFLEEPARLEPGQMYTITIEGVRDICGQGSFPQTFPLQSFVEGCGGLLFEAFTSSEINPPFGTYTELFHRTNISVFDSQLAFPVAPGNSYEGRMRGVFVPPFSGRWIFYLRSDGQSRLWLNPNGTNPTGKQLVQAETGCCQYFEALPTQPFSLMGGRPYYMEALYRQDFRPGYCQVAARLAGSTEALLPIGRRDLGQFALPGAAGHITVLQQPQDQAVLENRLVTMTVLATNDYGGPICYQWMKDGVEIVGANQASYSLRPSACDFEQAAFSVKLSIPGESVFSAAGVLTVGEDASPPRVIGASGSENLREIDVQFDDTMTETSAGDAFNYAVTNASGNQLEVEGAALNADGRSATLSTALQQPGVLYTVTVNGVRDIGCRPHIIWDGKASFTASMLVARVAFGSNTLSLSWNSRMWSVYRIQSSDHLGSNWVNSALGELVALGTNTAVNFPVNSASPSRFYRIQLVESR